MTIPSSDPGQSHPAPSESAPSEPGQSDAGQSDPVQTDPTRSERLGRARRFALHFCVVLLAASVVATAIGGPRAALSAALGVALAGVNLVLMQKITGAMTAGGGEGGNAAWGLVLPFKLVALVGVAYALVRGGVAQPVPLAMGFALLPLTGVFLPRPTSVPVLHSGSPARRDSSRLASPPPTRGSPSSRRRQPAS
jgi:hypothetical protein